MKGTRFWMWLGLLNAVLLIVFAYGPSPADWALRPGNWSRPWTLLSGSLFHADTEHLLGNLLSINVLLLGVHMAWPKQVWRLWAWSWVLSSLLLFVIGEAGSRHIGASTWVYALGFFMIVQGLVFAHPIYRRLAFAAVLWYGNLWQGMVPILVPANVSWEGHLAGALAGSAYLLLFRKSMNEQAVTLARWDELEGSAEEENPYDQL